MTGVKCNLPQKYFWHADFKRKKAKNNFGYTSKNICPEFHWRIP